MSSSSASAATAATTTNSTTQPQYLTYRQREAQRSFADINRTVNIFLFRPPERQSDQGYSSN